jgi:hypothetical protein
MAHTATANSINASGINTYSMFIVIGSRLVF